MTGDPEEDLDFYCHFVLVRVWVLGFDDQKVCLLSPKQDLKERLLSEVVNEEATVFSPAAEPPDQ